MELSNEDAVGLGWTLADAAATTVVFAVFLFVLAVV